MLTASRHLTGGGPDLVDMGWEADKLWGKSQLTAGDPYELYVYLPSGWNLNEVRVEGAQLESYRSLGPLRVITISSGDSLQAGWKIKFSRR
ncbi:MAG: hypothetical protein N3G18_08050 [Candidatus Saccharicenans sp.]|nr:hypothetical protein [Candidatus Saccharicenans sp.]